MSLYCLLTFSVAGQVCKYIAKLSLLERGLLDAAKGVDDLQQQITKSDEDEDKRNESTNESDQDFEKRVKLFVAVHLHLASSSKRDDYLDGLVYQTRKEVILEFLQSAILKKCQNEDCGA